MYALDSEGDSIGDALHDELYAAVVHALRTGTPRVSWDVRSASCPILSVGVKFEGKEGSYAGQEGGPIVKVSFVTLEGRQGWIRFIVPRRILRGEFPDTLHEVLATVFTASEAYDN